MTNGLIGPPKWRSPGPPSNDNGRPDQQGRKLVFIDVEASSLSTESHPIEVAYYAEDGVGEAFLIRPAEGWTDWSVASERLLGITRAQLLSEGASVDYVARRMATLLTDSVGVSDNPRFDKMWLSELFTVAGIEQPVQLVDIRDAFVAACHPLLRTVTAAEGTSLHEHQVDHVRSLARRIIAGATESEEMRPRVRHRAGPDALSMWRAWREIRRQVAGEVGERE